MKPRGVLIVIVAVIIVIAAVSFYPGFVFIPMDDETDI